MYIPHSPDSFEGFGSNDYGLSNSEPSTGFLANEYEQALKIVVLLSVRVSMMMKTKPLQSILTQAQIIFFLPTALDRHDCALRGAHLCLERSFRVKRAPNL